VLNGEQGVRKIAKERRERIICVNTKGNEKKTKKNF
jgi:hypothetical protein